MRPHPRAIINAFGFSQPRVHWTPTKRGFITRTQDGGITVELVKQTNVELARPYWDVWVNGKLRRITKSETSAKRLAREFL